MRNDNLFFRLLRKGLSTIDNEQLTIEHASLSAADCQLSIQQGVGAFIFDGLQKATEEKLLPADVVSREVKMQLFSHTMQVEKLCRNQYVRASELAGVYAEHGIRTVVLKGIAAGTCYPDSWHRPCGDLDCFLMDDYERGNSIAEEIGAKVKRDFYKHSHISYKGMMVENHRFCTGIRGNQKIKRFERLLQSVLKEEGTTRIGETALENPSPLFNALFLTHHAQRHLLSEGITLRHLCDWAMLLHKHGAEIDWSRFTAIADEHGLRHFADAMTCLSEAYLGVAVPLSYKIIVDSKREDALFTEIMKGLSIHEGGSLWQQRIGVFKNLVKNKHRFDLFSDISYLHFLFNTIYGFLFDRNPKI